MRYINGWFILSAIVLITGTILFPNDWRALLFGFVAGQVSMFILIGMALKQLFGRVVR